MRGQSRLTEGNLFSALLDFSLPFLLTNLLQALYGASDLFMVGRFANSVGVSAVATGGQVMQTITGLAIGLTTGGTVLIAKQFGAKRNREVADATVAIFAVFGVFSLVVTALTIRLTGPICTLMRVPPESLAATKDYLFICSCGILFLVGFNAVSGILRGLGDSRAPFWFMVAACLINVSTDLIFVGVLGFGAQGAAVSTVLAQAASLGLSAVYLIKRGYLKKYRKFQPTFHLSDARGVLGVGLPIALQEGLVNLSFLIITSIINGMGLIASASVGVVEKLIVFSMLPTTAFASAIAAMTAQHQGANLLSRAKKGLYVGIGLALAFGLGCFALAQTNPSGLVGIFSSDPRVIDAGALYLRSYSIDCVIVCYVFCVNAFLSGSGHPVFPLVHSLIATFLIRVPLSLALSKTGSMFAIGFAAPAASTLSLVLCQWYLARLQHRGAAFARPSNRPREERFAKNG